MTVSSNVLQHQADGSVYFFILQFFFPSLSCHSSAFCFCCFTTQIISPVSCQPDLACVFKTMRPPQSLSVCCPTLSALFVCFFLLLVKFCIFIQGTLSVLLLFGILSSTLILQRATAFVKEISLAASAPPFLHLSPNLNIHKIQDQILGSSSVSDKGSMPCQGQERFGGLTTIWKNWLHYEATN